MATNDQALKTNAAAVLPPELQPKTGPADSTTKVASGVAAVCTLIGLAVSAYFPNLTGTWEHWAAIGAPLAISLLGSLYAIRGRNNAIAPASSKSAAELAAIVQRERDNAAGQARQEVLGEVADARADTDDFQSDGLGPTAEQSALLSSARITDLPFSQLVEQMPELAEKFRAIAPALSVLSSLGSVFQEMQAQSKPKKVDPAQPPNPTTIEIR